MITPKTKKTHVHFAHPKHDVRVAGLAITTASAVALYYGGVLPQTSAMTALLSAALLVFGMPHGSFDLALLHNAASFRITAGSRASLIALYLTCAAAMYLLWQIAPVAALVGFLAMAVVHFAEDWDDCRSPFIAGGIAFALISAPSLLHGDALKALFILLTGKANAAILVDFLLLVAPTMLGLATVGVAMLWRFGQRALAISAGCALTAMILLPPVLGFALFFCLVHSPMQFSRHADVLGLTAFRQWRGIVIPLSLGGLAIAVMIYALGQGGSVDDGVFASSFMALSVLTAPHMIVPVILQYFQTRYSAQTA